jgi:hypothetical protein
VIKDDHAHVFLKFPPKYAGARVVGMSISGSRAFARVLRLRRWFRPEDLWDDGSAARTVATG